MEVARRIDELAKSGKPHLLRGRWETFSLRYANFPLGRIEQLGNHWEAARVFWKLALYQERAEIDPVLCLKIQTENVTGLTLDIPQSLTQPMRTSTLFLLQKPGKTDEFDKAYFTQNSDGSLSASCNYTEKLGWRAAPPKSSGLHKKHGLQGPIDDAFMDSFIFVRPTGKAANEKAGAWAKAEMERAIEHWRRHFRGEARVKDDTAITEDDIQSANLILWGDPSSNALIAKTAAQLPISWTGSEIKAGTKTFPAADHALICIYPNPLNPERYLVLNSSFTFREYDYLNNARQTPKLPDWAVIDLNQAPNARTPGGIAAADFFGEKWQLKPAE